MEWIKASVFCFTFCGLCSAMSNNEIEDFKNFLEKTSQLDQIFVKKGVNPDIGYDDDDSISDHAWEESGKFEGDLILNDRQRRIIVEDVVEGLSRNGIKDITKRWPDNELVYYIHREHFTGDQVQAIQDGIDDLARASCVKFRPYRRGDRDAVVIQGSRRGCFSNVGYQGGYQILNLNARHPPGRGCFRHGTIVHEMLHSLGFYHMQSSPDRDDYIDVKWENIHQPARHNFRKYNTFSVSDFGVGYDYDSVLHYSRRAFSINGQDTLVPKQSGASIGQRAGLSDKDAQKLNKMYCDNSQNTNNLEAADETPNKTATKKKKPKNVPFQGHGIGYHQGKTIVIKLPAAQTVKVSPNPIHFFGPFSKSSENLSPEAVKEIGFGQKVNRDYPVAPYLPVMLTLENQNATARKPTQDSRSESENDAFDKYGHENYDYYSPPYAKDESYKYYNTEDTSVEKFPKEYFYKRNLEQADDKESTTEKSTSNVNDSVDEAFDRLAQIIKTHVYPSQTPNLDIYKVKKDYSDLYKFKTDFKTHPTIAKLDKKFPSRIIHTNKKIKMNDGNTDKTKPSKNEVHYKQRKEPIKEKNNNPKISESSKYDKEYDSSFGTSFPLNKMPVVEEMEFVTPEYKYEENFANKNNHDYSGLYHTKENVASKKRKATLLHFLLPVHNEWHDSKDLIRDNEKYDRESYSHPADGKSEHLISSKIIQYEPDGSDAKEIFGRTPAGKAFSLFGVLVPLTHSWYRVDYDPYNLEYSSDKPEDYR